MKLTKKNLVLLMVAHTNVIERGICLSPTHGPIASHLDYGFTIEMIQ